MNIRFLIISFLVLIYSTAFSQKSDAALGKMEYQIKIAYTSVPGSDTTKKFYTQSHTLYFGKRSELNMERLPTSVSKDPKLVTSKNDTTRMTKSSVEGNETLKSAYNQASLHHISTPDILNISYKEYGSTERLSVKNSGLYSVVQNDTLPAMKWSIGQEEKQIMGVIATQATGHFRGRDYIAWFVKSIPVPAGPWKLYGLPGLILEARDTKGEVIIQLNALEIPVEFTIEKPKISGKVITQKEFIDLQRKKNEETAKMLRASSTQTQYVKAPVQTIRLVAMELK